MPGAGGEAQTTATQREGVQNTLPALPSVDELFRNVPDALPIAFHPRHAALTTLRPNVGCPIPSVHQSVNSVRPDERQRVPNTQVHSHQPTLNEHIGGVPITQTTALETTTPFLISAFSIQSQRRTSPPPCPG